MIATALLLLVAQPACLERPPGNALYRVIGKRCAAAPTTRASTGFRVGPLVYASLHGVIGCLDIEAVPQCPADGPALFRMRIDRASLASDVVALAPLAGLLRGPQLTRMTEAPVGTTLKVCGYPEFNGKILSCTQAFVVEEGQRNILSTLLDSAGDGATKAALTAYGIPSLGALVLRYDGVLSAGASGGPVATDDGRVYAMHDGRYELQGRPIHWGMPLWSRDTVMAPWATIKASVDAKSGSALPGRLEVAVEPAVAAAPPPREEQRAFLAATAEAVLAGYGCEWCRVGADVLNDVCTTSLRSECRPLAVGSSTLACGVDCTVRRIYARSLRALEPLAGLLCRQLAGWSGAAPSELMCSRLDEIEWYRSNAALTFGTVFVDVKRQMQLMREVHLATIPDTRRHQIVSDLLASWSADAVRRGVPAPLDRAAKLHAEWRDQGRAPFTVESGLGHAFVVSPTDDWPVLSAELLVRLVEYYAEQDAALPPPLCTGAGMVFGPDGRWRYTLGRPQMDGRTLAWWSGSADRTRAMASRTAEVLVAGAALDARLMVGGSSVAATLTGTIALGAPPALPSVLLRARATECEGADGPLVTLLRRSALEPSQRLVLKHALSIPATCTAVLLELTSGGLLARRWRYLLAPSGA